MFENYFVFSLFSLFGNLYLPPHFAMICLTLWIPLSLFGYRELIHHQPWVLSSVLRMQNSWCYCNSGTKTQRPWGHSNSLDHCWTDMKKHLKRSTFKSFHAYMEIKPQAEARNFSVRQHTPILQQSRNTVMNIIKGIAWSHNKPTDTTKHIIGQFIAFHREVIQLHLTDHRDKISQALNLAHLAV